MSELGFKSVEKLREFLSGEPDPKVVAGMSSDDQPPEMMPSENNQEENRAYPPPI
jgi:hypothetical protein